jgi:hypothetical protein
MAYYDDPEFKQWVRDTERDLIPKLEASGAVVSLVPEGEGDVKFAVELGLSIMMDKPIIAVVTPGRKVPNKLVLVADHIVEGDPTTGAGRERLMAALQDVMPS